MAEYQQTGALVNPGGGGNNNKNKNKNKTPPKAPAPLDLSGTQVEGTTIPILDGAGSAPDPYNLASLLPNVGPGQASESVSQRVASVSTMTEPAQQQLALILYNAGIITTKKTKYTTAEVRSGLLSAFELAQQSGATSLSNLLSTRASAGDVANPTANTTTVESASAIQQQVYSPQDITDQVNTAAQKLIGRNATQAEIQSVTDQLNADAATKAQQQSDKTIASEQQTANIKNQASGATAPGSLAPSTSALPPGGKVSAQQVADEIAAQGGTAVQQQVGAALVSGIESNGDPTELAGGIGPAAGLFQFEPGTWQGNGGGKYAPVAQGASWQQQVAVFINATKGNNFGAWGPDVGMAGYNSGGLLYNSNSKVGKWIAAHPNIVGNPANANQQAPTTGGGATPGGMSNALTAAQSQLGVPYQWGGEAPGSAFDCSGLVQWAFGQSGIHLPRVAQQQYDATTPVAQSNLQPGDLLFFGTSTSNISHVGIYVGGGKMIDAPKTGSDVRVDQVFNAQGQSTWTDFVGATSAGGTTGNPNVAATATTGTGATDIYQAPVIMPVDVAQQATDAAANYYENQDSKEYQANNLLTVFKAISDRIGTAGSPNVAVRNTPVSMLPVGGAKIA